MFFSLSRGFARKVHKIIIFDPSRFLSNCIIEIRQIVKKINRGEHISLISFEAMLSYSKQGFFSFLSLTNIRKFTKTYLYWNLRVGL